MGSSHSGVICAEVCRRRGALGWHRVGQLDVIELVGAFRVSRRCFPEFVQALLSAAGIPRSSQALRGLLSAPLPPRRTRRTHGLAATKTFGISYAGDARQCLLSGSPEPETSNPDTDDGQCDERHHNPGEGVLAERPGGFGVVVLGVHFGDSRVVTMPVTANGRRRGCLCMGAHTTPEGRIKMGDLGASGRQPGLR